MLVVIAERKEKLLGWMRVDKEKIQDEMHNDTDANGEDSFFRFLKKYCDNTLYNKGTDWCMERFKGRNIIDSKSYERQSNLYKIWDEALRIKTYISS